ncbi:phosphatase domain-containing protein [Methylorubrum extorquens]
MPGLVRELRWRRAPSRVPTQDRRLVVYPDRTLALTEHRAHFLNPPSKEKDWRGFYAACDRDEPCHPIIRTLLALHNTGAEVEIWSGRSHEVKDKTTAWLAEHGLGHISIQTRRAGDHRPDTVLKAEWLDEGRTPALVFEDRSSMVAMYRSRGIVCCQFAPGEF